MIKAKEYLMAAGGGKYIFDTELKYSTVLSVVRENMRFYSSGAADPGDTEYRKIVGSSSLEFAYEPAGGGPTGTMDIDPEKVRVIFKI